jgi:methionine--tRNA ligase beta chain
MSDMKFLGVDYGLKRVGIAFSDDGGKMAFPDSVLENNENLINGLLKICNEKGVAEIVVGESKNLQGEANPIMKNIKDFVVELKKLSNRNVHLEPEFMTSAQATRIQGENKMIDASAASIILQSFLDKKNNALNLGLPKISYDDFSKVEIKVGKIVSAEKVLNADKLLKLAVDFGEEKPRQVVSGIAETFKEPAVLAGIFALFVTNLEPRVIKGLESQAMILATGDKDNIILFKPDKPVVPGQKAR